jgi:3D (Asp-Asp-Asp) domain-containing protein
MERFDSKSRKTRRAAPARSRESTEAALGPSRVTRSTGPLSAWRLSETGSRVALAVGLVGLVVAFQILDRRVAQIDLFPPATEELWRSGAGDPSDPLYAGQTEGDRHRFVPVTVTGYTSCPSQTDDTPNITATLAPTRPGTLALSRDLLRTFTEGAPFDFGDRVLIPGMGIYVVEDTMHPRWQRRGDIWFHDTATARRWGRRQVYLTRVDADEPRLVAENWHPSEAI